MARYYTYTNEEGKKTDFVSVTTVIGILDKPALVNWAAKSVTEYLTRHVDELSGEVTEGRVKEIIKSSKEEYKRLSETALDVGSRTHAAAEAFLKKEDYVITPDIKKPFEAFTEWIASKDFQLIESEHTVFNTEFGYAGTMDIVCMLDGKKYIIDLKTSKGFFVPDMPVQLAAYAECVEGVEGIGILRLDKETGLPEWKDYTDVRDKSWETFRELLSIYVKWYMPKKIKANMLVEK